MSVRITGTGANATVGVVVSNPWLSRRVLNYAHQGGAREGPSSTLFAMRAAVAAGADALELDVHMTSDGVLVVCHDATVDRTTEGSGALSSMTFAAVSSLDNAYWWVPGSVVADDRSLPAAAFPYRGRAASDPAFRVPRLADVLDEMRGVYLNLDVKQTAPAVVAYESALADLLRAHDRVDDVIVASFNDASTAAFHACAPEIATSYGTMATADFFRAVRAGEPPPPPPIPHAALQVPRTFADTVVVDAPFVAAAHALGVAVHVWTIDDEPEMELLLDLDVDGIMTDRPSVLASVMRRRGL
jgi:glycerophosphoryl diester phosphodiesterase